MVGGDTCLVIEMLMGIGKILVCGNLGAVCSLSDSLGKSVWVG